MRKLIATILALASGVMLYAQHERFKPIELEDLQKYFSVHDAEEGPGIDYYGMLLLRLRLPKRIEPMILTKSDIDALPSLLKETGSRYGVKDHSHKLYFEFPSNAPWKEGNAILTIFINDALLSAYNQEIGKEDEVWLFFTLASYDTFKMEGYARIVDFLSRDHMIKKNLLVVKK